MYTYKSRKVANNVAIKLYIYLKFIYIYINIYLAGNGHYPTFKSG